MVEGLARIVEAPKSRVTKAEEGLKKLLGRDASSAEAELEHATSKLQQLKAREREKLGIDDEEASPDGTPSEAAVEEHEEAAARGTLKKGTEKIATVKTTEKRNKK